jgi:uncharacterized protein (TIGR03435 family)
MLRSLLADRFKLVLHNENRPLTAYLMTAVKGKSKLKETDGSGSPGCQPQLPANNSNSVPMVQISCRNITMDAFAASIHAMAGGYLTNPVVNSTGLQGAWDFDLRWTPRGALAQLGADGISVFDAVEKQLGLKLDLQKVPMPVIVVDSANQKPTDNPPGVITKLPPAPPAEFEVAVIKASQPGATPGGRGFLPGGRIEVLGVPLKLLVSLAWNLGPGEELTGAPKWLDSDSARYDLIAKVSSSALIGAPDNNQPPVDIDDMRVMIRALLAERFQLKTHYEDRPVATYTLVTAKPKLKTADPSNRTGCKTGPAPLTRESSNAGPVPFQVTCQNMTMKQFAEQLQNIAPLYLQKPVSDATGIDGSWDFTFQFNFVLPGQGGGRGGGDRQGKSGPGGGGGEVGCVREERGPSRLTAAQRPTLQASVTD